MTSIAKRKVYCVFSDGAAPTSSDEAPPKKARRDVKTIRFVLHDFKNRKESRGESIESPRVQAYGYDWSIEVYPRGDTNSDSKKEWNSCFVNCYGEIGNTVTVWFSIRIQGIERSCASKHREFVLKDGFGAGWGWHEFRKRKEVLEDCLEEDGSLIIEADIQVVGNGKTVWYPKELERQDILVDLYQDASSETSDVSFFTEEPGKMTQFKAHKIILGVRCKKLYDIATKGDNSSGNKILIPSIRTEIFKSILDYLYTVKSPEIENEEDARDLLVASDRFDCVQLKLYVESVIVDKFLAVKNAVSMLMLADTHSCALLKEASAALIVRNAKEVTKTNAWSELRESGRLLEELFGTASSLIHQSPEGDEKNTDENEIDGLNVAALREALEAAGLRLDGNREALVYRLRNHRQDTAELATDDPSSSPTEKASDDAGLSSPPESPPESPPKGLSDKGEPPGDSNKEDKKERPENGVETNVLPIARTLASLGREPECVANESLTSDEDEWAFPASEEVAADAAAATTEITTEDVAMAAAAAAVATMDDAGLSVSI